MWGLDSLSIRALRLIENGNFGDFEEITQTNMKSVEEYTNTYPDTYNHINIDFNINLTPDCLWSWNLLIIFKQGYCS